MCLDGAGGHDEAVGVRRQNSEAVTSSVSGLLNGLSANLSSGASENQTACWTSAVTTRATAASNNWELELRRILRCRLLLTRDTVNAN